MAGMWVVDDEDDIIERTGNLHGVYVAHKGSGRVAQAFRNCRVTTDSECRANARLIAAAPDLIAAAIKARAALSELVATRDPVVYADALRALDEAIAKAEGSTP